MTGVYTVLHHLDRDTTLTQAEVALTGGADGIFLISHAGEDAPLAGIARELRNLWAARATAAGGRPLVGLCLLTVPPASALAAAAEAGAGALWVGASGISAAGVAPDGQALAQAMRRHIGVDVFAGVAFKHQAEEPDPPAAARIARSLGMIPTTSGAATGAPPALAKIAAMSSAVAGRLAIASGMNLENVSRFAPLLSHILVSTGVSRGAHTIDLEKLRAFVTTVRHAGRQHRPASLTP